jgi:hypothetical protein
VAQKGPFGVLLMLLLPTADKRRVELVLARGLRERFAGLDLADYLQLEAMDKAASVQSRRERLLSPAKEA